MNNSKNNKDGNIVSKTISNIKIKWRIIVGVIALSTSIISMFIMIQFSIDKKRELLYQDYFNEKSKSSSQEIYDALNNVENPMFLVNQTRYLNQCIDEIIDTIINMENECVYKNDIILLLIDFKKEINNKTLCNFDSLLIYHISRKDSLLKIRDKYTGNDSNKIIDESIKAVEKSINEINRIRSKNDRLINAFTFNMENSFGSCAYINLKNDLSTKEEEKLDLTDDYIYLDSRPLTRDRFNLLMDKKYTYVTFLVWGLDKVNMNSLNPILIVKIFDNNTNQLIDRALLENGQKTFNVATKMLINKEVRVEIVYSEVYPPLKYIINLKNSSE